MDKILTTGRYLNVIRECGHKVVCPDAQKLKYTFHEREYVEAIEHACSFSSQALLSLLVEDHQLLERLRCCLFPCLLCLLIVCRVFSFLCGFSFNVLFVCVCVHVCMYLCTSVCLSVCLSVCIYICVCMCVCVLVLVCVPFLVH